MATITGLFALLLYQRFTSLARSSGGGCVCFGQTLYWHSHGFTTRNVASFKGLCHSSENLRFCLCKVEWLTCRMQFCFFKSNLKNHRVTTNPWVIFKTRNEAQRNHKEADTKLEILVLTTQKDLHEHASKLTHIYYITNLCKSGILWSLSSWVWISGPSASSEYVDWQRTGISLFWEP